MILDDVIVEARKLLQDTSTSTLQRYSDAYLLGVANQVLKRVALLRPDLFSYIGEITCVAGEVLQTTPSDAIRLMEIFRVKNGTGVRETSKAILDETHPTWADDDDGPCVSWMRHTKSQTRFFIYPKSPVTQILIGEYAKSPTVYDGTTEVTELPDVYFPAVVDGLVFLVESVDNEHVDSGRAALFQQSFVQLLSGSLATQAVTDVAESATPKKGAL
jgi:hypothetical protein